MNVAKTSTPARGSRDTKRATQKPRKSGAARRSRGPAPIELVRHVDYELFKARQELADTAENRWFVRELLSWRIASLVEWQQWLTEEPGEGTGRVNDRSELSPPASGASKSTPTVAAGGD